MAGETERGFSRMPQKSDSGRATHVWRRAGGTRPRLQLGERGGPGEDATPSGHLGREARMRISLWYPLWGGFALHRVHGQARDRCG